MMKSKFKVVLLVAAITTLMATAAVAAVEEAPLFRERGFGRGLNLEAGAIEGRLPRLKGLRLHGLGFHQQLLEKTGLSKEEFVELLKSGKTIEEIAEEYSINLEELKEEVLNEKLALVDERVNSGELTAEEGALIKERLQERFENWDFTSKPMLGGFKGIRMLGGCRGASLGSVSREIN
jgi:hypothetical protein